MADEQQNQPAGDTPYVEERPAAWNRISKTRRIALGAATAIVAIASVFAVNAAIASNGFHPRPLFDKGGRHDFGGIAPAAPGSPGTLDGGLPVQPKIHQMPPTAVHPDEETEPQGFEANDDNRPAVDSGIKVHGGDGKPVPKPEDHKGDHKNGEDTKSGETKSGETKSGGSKSGETNSGDANDD